MAKNSVIFLIIKLFLSSNAFQQIKVRFFANYLTLNNGFAKNVVFNTFVVKDMQWQS